MFNNNYMLELSEMIQCADYALQVIVKQMPIHD